MEQELPIFSQLAVLDFQPLQTTTPGNVTEALSELRIIDSTPADPHTEGDGEVAEFSSQACPRFVPSRKGAELLFVAESVHTKNDATGSQSDRKQGSPMRRLALVDVPKSHSIIGGSAPEQTAAEKLPEEGASVTMLPWGYGHIPYAPVHGCPEFVPTLYASSKSLSETLSERLSDSLYGKGFALGSEPEEQTLSDTFTFLSDTMTSASVLGVDAQEIAVSLDEGAQRGKVSRVQLLYDVGRVPGTKKDLNGGRSQLLLDGCQPIRAAGREGHMQLQKAMDRLQKMWPQPQGTVRKDVGDGYTAWLVCMTADQRVAIVQSPEQKHWMNMTMPYPTHTGTLAQGIWCRHDREEACFEVWANPNPNERIDADTE